MSILTDHEITRRCIAPTHTFVTDETTWHGSEPFTAQEETLLSITRIYEQYMRTTYNADGVGQRDGLATALVDILPKRNAMYALPVHDTVVQSFEPMISPFHRDLVRTQGEQKIISHGLSSMGYDVRLADTQLSVFNDVYHQEVDPMNLDIDRVFAEPEIRTCARTGHRYVLLAPNSYLLGHTPEVFCIPRDILVICLAKSTWARAAIGVNVTPIEPGFRGQVVIEVINHSRLPARIYLNMGIAQFVFLKADDPCLVSYADRGGKYQGQMGLTHAKV